MAVQRPGAHSWASQVSDEEFRLSELDLHVLGSHPEILAALGRRWRTGPSADTMALVAALPAGLGSLVLAPGWFRQTQGEPWLEPVDFGDGAASTSSFFFLGALVALAVLAALWLRRGRLRAGAEVFAVVFTLVAGIVALPLMASVDVDVLGFAPVSLPVWAATAAAVVVLGAFTLASVGRRAGDAQDFRVTGPADLARADALIAALPPRKAKGLASERTRALGRLRERGMITAGQAAEVEALPIGSSVTLDAR
ncbi:hypothetical protein SAMN02982929_03750 [Saccharopolyspora kobensis]|uniref:Uncharacterized protein n=1 Tax=Saccharopolyspora kobensis TaxID=146035 RepID=A0A1H6CZ47_9PSEU|nr:hypothetical protein [Saccharopolyspora kobensis]SEG78419.1 hypothetical protein SAMN02982929_03750 [Saccharopolyspora kobensis]SFD05315.1 hypothetical protein SAMN05216506_102345 [Saccharopolyspora kobensis]